MYKEKESEELTQAQAAAAASASVLLDELVAQHPTAKQWIDDNLRGAVSTLEKRAGDHEVDAAIRWLNIENGKIDMALAGKAVERLALLITSWYREGGAKNYVEMTIHDVEDPAISYSFIVQKTGDGAKSAHQLRKDAEERAEALQARLDEKSKLLEARSDDRRYGSFVEADFAAAIHGLVRRRESILDGSCEAGGGIHSDLGKLLDVIESHAAKLSVSEPSDRMVDDAPSIASLFQRSWESGFRNVLGMFGTIPDHRDHALKAMTDERDRYAGLIEVLNREIAASAGVIAGMSETADELQTQFEALTRAIDDEQREHVLATFRIETSESEAAKARDGVELILESARHLSEVHALEARVAGEERGREGFGRHNFHLGAAGVADVFLGATHDLLDDVAPQDLGLEDIRLTKPQEATLNSLNAGGLHFVNYGRGCGVSRASALALKRIGLADVLPDIKTGVAARITHRGRAYIAYSAANSSEVAK
jgi:hypothetical protein